MRNAEKMCRSKGTSRYNEKTTVGGRGESTEDQYEHNRI